MSEARVGEKVTPHPAIFQWETARRNLQPDAVYRIVHIKERYHVKFYTLETLSGLSVADEWNSYFFDVLMNCSFVLEEMQGAD